MMNANNSRGIQRAVFLAVEFRGRQEAATCGWLSGTWKIYCFDLDHRAILA